MIRLTFVLRRAVVRLCALLLFAPLLSFASTFSLEQVMSSPFPSQLHGAQQVPRIVWASNKKGVRNIWIADAPDFVARQITQYASDDGQGISSVRITPDGQTIVYVLGSPNHKGEVPNPDNRVQRSREEIWAVDANGGRARLLGLLSDEGKYSANVQLSPDSRLAAWTTGRELWVAHLSGSQQAQPVAYSRGESHDPRWSPDGKQIAVVSSRGDHSFVAIYEFGNDKIRYISPSVDRDVMPRWSPDGKQIAFVRLPGVEKEHPLILSTPTPWSIWVENVSNGRVREVWHSAGGKDDGFSDLTQLAFAADNRIVFTSEQDGWSHLYSVSAEGGSPLLLTPGNFEVEGLSLSLDQGSILFSSNQEDADRRHIWRVSVKGGPAKALTHGETIEWSPVEVQDAKTVVCLGSSATVPATLYRITSGGREVLDSSLLPADFPSGDLVTPQEIVFKAEDNLEIHGQLFVPKDRLARAAAIVYLHGGPERQMVLGFHYLDYYHYAYAQNQYLASLGYVVLSVNYRTGTMYGRAFREPSNSGWRGASEYKDVVAAGRYLQSLPNVDAARIGVWGGSYGGYLTALALARNSNIFAAGVDLHGVHNWSTFLGPSDSPDAAEASKLAFKSSPIASISTWTSPVLLIHGDNDDVVDFSQTVDLVQRLRQHKVGFEQVIFPDELHDFLLWRSWISAYAATAAFFDRVLKRQEAIPIH